MRQISVLGDVYTYRLEQIIYQVHAHVYMDSVITACTERIGVLTWKDVGEPVME